MYFDGFTAVSILLLTIQFPDRQEAICSKEGEQKVNWVVSVARLATAAQRIHLHSTTLKVKLKHDEFRKLSKGVDVWITTKDAAAETVGFLPCTSFLFTLRGEEERHSLTIQQQRAFLKERRRLCTDAQEERAGRCLRSDPAATDSAEGRPEFRPAGRRVELLADCQT